MFEYNALVYFWLEVTLIVVITFMIISTYRNRYFKKDADLKKAFKNISIAIFILISVIIINYTNLTSQGLQSIYKNPYTIAKASNLAPPVDKVSTINQLDKLTDDQKLKTTLIIYKFGCPDCQRLWIKTKKQKELLPSNNVMWIPTNDFNKKHSEIIKKAKRYPTIIQWVKIDDEIKEIITEEPNEQQLDNIIEKMKK